MSTMKLNWLLITTGFVLSGCVAETLSEGEGVGAPDARATDEDGLVTIDQSLNGSLTFGPGCTATHRTNLTNAVNYIGSRIGSSQVRECLKNVTLYEAHDYTPEDMISRMRAVSSYIDCAELTGGGGSTNTLSWTGGPNPEVFTIDSSDILTESMGRVAEIIMHEVAHRQGFAHTGDQGVIPFEFSVNEQIGDCILDYDGFGADDNDVGVKEVELPWLGGGGGGVYRTMCPVGTRVIGATGYSSTTQLNGLRFRCSNSTNSGLIGTATGTAITKNCAAGESVAGFRGLTGGVVKGLFVGCDSDTDLQNNLWNGFNSLTGIGGAGGVNWVDRVCPTGHAVVGAVGRHGGAVDSIRFICRDFDGATIEDPYLYGQFGTINGATMKSTVGYCPDYGALISLWGNAGAELDSVGGSCTRRANGFGPFGSVVLEGDLNASDQEVYGSLVDYGGGTSGGGQGFELGCPSGKAIVGLRARSGARVNAIGAVCAFEGEWSTGVTTSMVNLPLQGGSGGTYSVILCPTRSFVVGLETWAKATPELGGSPTTVHGLSPMCRKLN